MSRDFDSPAALTRRILATLGLVVLADACFVAVLGFLLRPWLAPVLGPVGGDSAIGWTGWSAVIALAAGALVWAQLRYTRREALSATDARRVSESEFPELHARLWRLARAADVPPPDLAVAESDVPNSFTLGDIGRGTVVVTTGLLDALSDDELDAVLAHELAHLRNRDATVMTLATFLPALANDEYALLSSVGTGTRRLALGVAAVLGYAVSTALVPAPAFSLVSLVAFGGFVALTVLFGGVALGLLAIPVVVLSGRLSRYRELVADRAGALLAGDPVALATALETLDESVPDRPETDVRAGGVRELCVHPYGVVRRDESEPQRSRPDPLAGLPLDVETHPPTEERIRRLRALAAEGTDAYGSDDTS